MSAAFLVGAVVPLSRPIEAHGRTLAQLELRRPTGKDLRTAGVPYKITTDGEVAIEGAAMHRMIASLASIPPSAADMLDGADWEAASREVLNFIMNPPAPKKAPETEPAPAG